MTHVQGHNIKYSNSNNSAAHCAISLKFGTEFRHVTSDPLQMFKIKVQRSTSQAEKSKALRRVRYQHKTL